MVLIARIEISAYALDVSVPLRGLWFLSQAKGWEEFEDACSFRPLAGIMVLI